MSVDSCISNPLSLFQSQIPPEVKIESYQDGFSEYSKAQSETSDRLSGKLKKLICFIINILYNISSKHFASLNTANFKFM